MSQLVIFPSKLKGSAKIPSSKSHTLRAILFAGLAKGKSIIYDYLKSPDTHSMIHAMRLLGAEIQISDGQLEILGINRQFKPCENVIDAGNSGQVLRFVGAISGLIPAYTILTGDYSIRHYRPIISLLSGINQLKGFATSARLDDRPPIIIKGCMQPGIATIDGLDSQPVSGLLIATSFLDGESQLIVKNSGEKPWIDLTLWWIKRFGGKISHVNYEKYFISGPLTYEGFQAHIPGDFSSAAFLIIAALITRSHLILENLDFEDIQGDKKIIEILQKMGAKLEPNQFQKSLYIHSGAHLKGIKIDANEIIDAVPILAVLACFVEGKTEIFNASIARKKESDRLKAISMELKKMGALIEETEDGLIILSSPLHGATVSSYSDHRIGMALSIAALGAKGTTTIDDVECLNKSFPDFALTLKKLHAELEEK